MRIMVKDKDTYYKACLEIQKQTKEHGKVIVSISLKDDRSSAQNRLMQQWFKDINHQSQAGIEYESGRCKIEYFLPVMGRSENQKVREQCELLRFIYKERGHEFLSYLLGNSMVESTRLLGVKDFAEALTAMYRGECQYRLTDPSMHGLNDDLELIK